MNTVRGEAGITSSFSISTGKYVRDASMEMNMSMGVLVLETFPSK